MAKSASEKLGYAPGLRALVEGAPDAPKLGIESQGEGPHDLMLFFVRSAGEVAPVADRLDTLYRDGAKLWFAYPKKSGSIRADISRDHGWEALAALEFLPVTQVALDDDWSALRFRRRSEIPRLTRKF